MIIPVTPCTLYKSQGYDRNGQPRPLTNPIYARCCVVSLTHDIGKSKVRGDSSASYGNAAEELDVARLLFPVTTDIDMGDKIEVMGHSLRVVKTYVRNRVQGDKDHIQVDCETWR